MNLLSENIEDKTDKYKIKNYLLEVIIGGNCIISKNIYRTERYYYIILNKENSIYNIDYILLISDDIELRKEFNFILKENIYNYLKKVNISENDEYKEIINDKNKKIGYIIRVHNYSEINKNEKNSINKKRKYY